MTTIYILWIRQLKRYVRSRARIIASLGQPLLFLLGLGFGMEPVFQKAGQGSYIQFLAPGIVGMTLLFTSVFSGMEGATPITQLRFSTISLGTLRNVFKQGIPEQ